MTKCCETPVCDIRLPTLKRTKTPTIFPLSGGRLEWKIQQNRTHSLRYHNQWHVTARFHLGKLFLEQHNRVINLSSVRCQTLRDATHPQISPRRRISSILLSSYPLTSGLMHTNSHYMHADQYLLTNTHKQIHMRCGPVYTVTPITQ